MRINNEKSVWLFIVVIIIVLSISIYLLLNIKSLNGKNTKNVTTTRNSNEYSDIIGKWETISGINSETGKETKNLVDIFGSSYREYGSYLEFKKDGTFIDAIEPITDGSKSNIGNYIIKKDYYKLGDYYVFLLYSDGHEEKLQKVFLDDSNVPYLVLENFINGYQLFFKKS